MGRKFKFSKIQVPVFIMAIGFAVGWYLSQSSPVATEGASFSSISRDPAAIRPVFDFSSLQGNQLGLASAQRLLSGAHIVHEKDDVGLELGHFVVKSSSGDKQFACQKYSQVILFFESEGMAVSGEKSKMEVEGLCEISADINSISPLWIPTAKILGEPVADGEFDFREGRVVKIRFFNVSDEWPRTWQLKSLKLVSKTNAEESLNISEQDLNQVKPEPILLSFGAQ